MGLQATPIPDLWGFQPAQMHAVKGLVDHLAAGLHTSVSSLSGITYDGLQRLTHFVADSVTFDYSYPDTSTINLAITQAGATTIKQITLNGAGQITGITTL